MTPEQISLCKSSWAKVEPIADDAAALFYSNLFEADSSLKTLFPTDMKAQGNKLMKMITSAVNMLDRLDELVPIVQALGIRHVSYGVEESQYDTVGGALIKTLETGLGEDFTSDVKTAWITAYNILATTMIEASYRDPVA